MTWGYRTSCALRVPESYPRRARRAPVSSKSCERPVEQLPREPIFGHILANFGQRRPTLGQKWPKSAQIGRVGQDLPNYRQHWLKLVRFGQRRASLVKCCPFLADVGQHIANLGHIWANVGRRGKCSASRAQLLDVSGARRVPGGSISWRHDAQLFCHIRLTAISCDNRLLCKATGIAK